MNKLLLDSRPVLFQPELAVALGSVQQAIILQQLHWLLQLPNSGTDYMGHHWVWGTYNEWTDDYFPFWSSRALQHHVRELEKRNLIVSTTRLQDEAAWDNRKYYRIDYQTLHEFVSSNIHKTVSSMVQDLCDNKEEQETSTETSNVPLFWQKNFPGMFTPHITERLTAMEEEYGAEEVVAAMKIAVERNARTLRYVEGVLDKRASGWTPSEGTDYGEFVALEDGR